MPLPSTGLFALLRGFFFLAAAALSLAGARGSDDEYFNTHVGDERISDVVFISPLGKVEKSTLTVSVKEKAERDGKSYFRVRFVMDGAYAREYTKLERHDADGVYAIDERDKDSHEAMQLALPFKAGESHTIKSDDGDTKVTVVALESVEAGGKTYENCWHVQMVPPLGIDFTRDVWLAPQVGAVKSETHLGNNGKIFITLRQFTPGAPAPAAPAAK